MDEIDTEAFWLVVEADPRNRCAVHVAHKFDRDCLWCNAVAMGNRENEREGNPYGTKP